MTFQNVNKFPLFKQMYFSGVFSLDIPADPGYELQ